MASVYCNDAVVIPCSIIDISYRKHLDYIENMRGVTILLVIASHCYGLAWSGSTVGWSMNDPLLSVISGATPVFVFISGFFLHHVFRSAIDYPAFIMKKARALLPPYLVITAILMILEWMMGLDRLRYVDHVDLLTRYAVAVMTGGSGPAMWYIPFIFDLFLLSPVFLLLLRTGRRAQIAVLAILFVVGVLVDRSALSRVHNLGHFAFYYAFGIFCGAHRPTFEAIVRRRWVIAALLVGIGALVAAQYWFNLEELAGRAVMWPASKFVYVRKIGLILLLAGVLGRIADRAVPGLQLIARWSFGLFFVHQVPILLLMSVAARGWIAPGYGALAVYTTIVFALSMGLLWTVRRVFGERSRLLVGV